MGFRQGATWCDLDRAWKVGLDGIRSHVASRDFVTGAQLCQNLIQRRGQVANPHATGVVDRVDDRRCCTADPEFADPLCVERIGSSVALLQQHHLDLGNIRIYGHMVARHVTIDDMAVAPVMDQLFRQRHADAESHPAQAL